MSGANLYIEHEKAKNKFKMIFGEDADNYRFAGASHINMVAEYGKFCGDIKRSLEFVDLHLKVQEDFVSTGVYLGDEKIQEMILNVLR